MHRMAAFLASAAVTVSCFSSMPTFAPATAIAQEQQQPTAQSLWEDFNHYVRVARPDLAQAAAVSLMGQVDNQQLLDIVEASDYAGDYEMSLARAAKIDTLQETAEELSRRIQQARIERSRQPERIAADIQRLSEGPRAYQNAIERLRAAGQYAAPQLLATVVEEKQQQLHPYALSALVAIGRPVVYPLASALPELDPRPLGQIAQVLAEIGYPRSLPYLKQVLERTELDPKARQLVQSAYNQLASTAGVPDQVSAAELYLTLGDNLYRAGTTGEQLPNFDSAISKGIIWEYTWQTGLVAVEVPGQVHADVLAMRASQTALTLDPTMDPALSLWLTGNLRRENRLAADEIDPSYMAQHPPIFYVKAAGPLRQHDVLERALDDADTPLALDAIEALRDTAGTDALINREGTAQPLVRALSYPDRRVRFAAAFTMAQARPDAPFPGSFRVVPVLAEAARQTDVRYALLLAPDQAQRNEMGALLRDLGYRAISAATLQEAADPLSRGTGVDLVIAVGDVEQVQSVFQKTDQHYMLAAVPVLALVSTGDQIELNRRFPNQARLITSVISSDSSALAGAVEQASEAYAGAPIGQDEAFEFASTSLTLLEQIALGSAEVFNVTDALPSLISALDDDRPQVVMQAADVLAMIERVEAQRAIAEAALEGRRSQNLRVHLLDALAASSTHLGNELTDLQLENVLELVNTSRGDLAVAAARAHGALTLPTSNVVTMITAE